MASSRRPANWKRPSDLTREEAVAYDVASAFVAGGVLPEVTYRQSIAAFGEEGTAEFINLVGLYCMVSVTLNGFDVPVPASKPNIGLARTPVNGRGAHMI